MAKLKEEKKREILDFIEKNVEEDNLLPLEMETVVEKFTDETYDRESIEQIVGELDDNDLVETKSAKLEVVYPKNDKKYIESKLGNLSTSSSVFANYFTGTIIAFFLLDYEKLFGFIFGDAIGEPQTLVVQGMLFGVVANYYLGKGVIHGYSIAQENIVILQEQKHLILPIGLIGAVVGGSLVLYTSYTSQPLTTDHVLQILSISVLGGIALGKLFDKKREE
ncbi:hypothetical protein [Halorussus caseinilyticus]|uniref:DUF1700 domain-containing protein n=1 Tax=Halorussus caseinilyticus TaxID=3034025 RepID=A0ABD5WRW0_9EURY|nr:hypothetical protein [Halorussus sp. DT72]